MMFNYLLLKDTYQLSDMDVVEGSYSDTAFRYFLF
ncbi:TPA: transposase [Streptococcus suis]